MSDGWGSSGGYGGGQGGQGNPPGGYGGYGVPAGPPAGPPGPMGPGPGGYGSPPPMAPEAPSGLAIAALVLGIVAWFVGLGPLTSLPGVILGAIELKKIKRGESPQAGKVYAQIGFWVSLVNLVLIGGLILLVCGFSLLSAVANR